MCYLVQLQESLCHREVFVPQSSRWSDPRAKLLQGKEWEGMRPTICNVLKRSSWEQELDAAYKQTIINLTPEAKVQIVTTQDELTKKTSSRLHIDALEPQPEPGSLKHLRWLTNRLMPMIDLPTLLLEIESRTHFAQEFTHISEQPNRVSDFPISLCAALLTQACNVPISAVAQKGIPALEADRLIHITQNYIRPETISRANARLVEVHKDIPLTAFWGGGEIASADGIRFVVPVRSVITGPNPHYFGPARGITLLNYTLNHFFGFNGAVVTGTIRDSLNILNGLLGQESPLLQPQEIMTDSASYSDLVFGIFSLLGYQFSPRLADITDTRFWRFAMDADYGPLNGLSQHRITSDSIEANWDDMLRLIGSLKMGRIKPDEVISMIGGKHPTQLGRAIIEVGRIAKTVFLLHYINDENFRRRIEIQLNRGESRHGLARAVFHGRKGELRQAYREGMEEQLGSLGLVVNIIVLWNSLYLDRAVPQLREQGFEIFKEDLE